MLNEAVGETRSNPHALSRVIHLDVDPDTLHGTVLVPLSVVRALRVCTHRVVPGIGTMVRTRTPVVPHAWDFDNST